MNSLLDTVPLSFHEWLFVFGFTFSIVIIIEIIKIANAFYNKITGKKRTDVNAEALAKKDMDF